jgi:hypothetical protein
MDDEQTTEIEDTEGHMPFKRGVEPADDADTEGHRIKRG